MFEDNNLETFSLVWLDVSIDGLEKSIDIQQRLRAVVNRLKIFQQIADCEQYIKSVPKEDRVVLIVNEQLSSKIIPHIQQLRQISSIYFYGLNKAHNSELIPEVAKVKYVTGDLEDLVCQFASDQPRREFDHAAEPLSFTVFNTNGDNDRSTTELNGQFVHSQLLLDCLIRMKSLPSDKNELILRIQKEYQGNAHGLTILREFHENYSCDRALWWYTRASFLYRILNKALRLQDIELLFLFRFFIRDIQLQIQTDQCPLPTQVYRGQLISNEELEILKKSKEQFISINSFLSTSVRREVALIYVAGFTPSMDTQPILFEIHIDSQLINNKPAANITSQSCFPSEEEVLFMPGSIYRIVDLVYEGTLWVIRMILCNDSDHELKSVFEYMKKSIW